MKRNPQRVLPIFLLLGACVGAATEADRVVGTSPWGPGDEIGAATEVDRVVGTSPWGPGDEIGRLNLITPESQAAILSRLAGGKNYDLSVEYFIGMHAIKFLNLPSSAAR